MEFYTDNYCTNYYISEIDNYCSFTIIVIFFDIIFLNYYIKEFDNYCQSMRIIIYHYYFCQFN